VSHGSNHAHLEGDRIVFSKLVIKERKKPEKFWLPHGRPSDDRAFACSSRVFPKASQIKALYKLWHYQFTTMEKRPDERIDHLDQRRGADNRVKLVKPQCLERCNVQVKKPIGAIEPWLSLKGMVMLLLALRLMTQMMMVPSEHQCLSDLLRHLSKELGINHCGLLITQNRHPVS
jgi:hypothetical protein